MILFAPLPLTCSVEANEAQLEGKAHDQRLFTSPNTVNCTLSTNTSTRADLVDLSPVLFAASGQFLYETGRLREAAAVYVRGTELAPTEYDLTFNLANVYRELGRYQQAEHFYRRAAHIRPEVRHISD